MEKGQSLRLRDVPTYCFTIDDDPHNEDHALSKEEYNVISSSPLFARSKWHREFFSELLPAAAAVDL